MGWTNTGAREPVDGAASGSAGPDRGVADGRQRWGVLLVGAHRASIANRSYTWTVTYAERSEGLRRRTRWRVRRGRNRTTVRRTTRLGGGDGGSVGVGSHAGTCDAGGGEAPRHRAGRYLGQFLATQGSDARVVERGGTALVRVVAAGNAYAVGGLYGPEVRNYSATALVTPAGHVRRLVATYDRVEDGRTVHVRVTFRYTAVGRTELESAGDRPRNATAGCPVGP